jgi:hypothetical protein
MIASVQRTSPGHLITGTRETTPRALPSSSDPSTEKLDPPTPSSLDQPSQTASPQDKGPTDHSAFGVILSQYFRTPGSSPATDKSETRETSSPDDCSPADAPEDADRTRHSTLGVIPHQYSRVPSSSDRSAQSDRASQQKPDASATSLLGLPVLPNEKVREISPLALAIPWSKNDGNASGNPGGCSAEVTAQSSETAAGTPDAADPTPSSGKSAPQGNPLQAVQSGELTFAARLSPAAAPGATGDAFADAESLSTAHSQSTPKQTISSDPVPSLVQAPGEKGASDASGDPLPKMNILPPQMNNQTLPPPTQSGETRSVSGSPPVRAEPAVEPPASQPSSSRDITVRIPDSTERGTNVRFVERGSEVHVSVRTGDSELAQTLRGGLGELSARLQHNGIQAEVWRPNSNSSQGDSRDRSPDQGDSGERRNPSGAQRDGQDQPSEHKPRWVEQLEAFIGKPAPFAPPIHTDS